MPISKPRLRYPKSSRLNEAGHFQQLKAEGLSFHGRLMVLSVLKQPGGLPSRVGLITSRRVGGAVIRNRVRRQLRESVRLDWPLLSPSVWLVLVARQKASLASFAELQKEWRTLAKRAGVME